MKKRYIDINLDQKHTFYIRFSYVDHQAARGLSSHGFIFSIKIYYLFKLKIVGSKFSVGHNNQTDKKTFLKCLNRLETVKKKEANIVSSL